MSAEPVQELSSCQPTRKSAASFRIHSYVIRWCCSPGCFAPCPLGKFCQELMLSFLDLEIEIPRTLSSAKNPRTLSSAKPAHSEKCDSRLLETPRARECSAISCSTHLVELSPSCVSCLSNVLPVALPRFCCVELPLTGGVCHFLGD